MFAAGAIGQMEVFIQDEGVIAVTRKGITGAPLGSEKLPKGPLSCCFVVSTATNVCSDPFRIMGAPDGAAAPMEELK